MLILSKSLVRHSLPLHSTSLILHACKRSYPSSNVLLRPAIMSLLLRAVALRAAKRARDESPLASSSQIPREASAASVSSTPSPSGLGRSSAAPPVLSSLRSLDSDSSLLARARSHAALRSTGAQDSPFVPPSGRSSILQRSSSQQSLQPQSSPGSFSAASLSAAVAFASLCD